MVIDKTLISHIVAELLVIVGLSYYYHKKCTNLQNQINELNSKIEKMNGMNYLNTIKKHEQFESQTVHHINKIYSLINNMNNVNNSNVNSNMNIISNTESFKLNNENVIKENFYTETIGSNENINKNHTIPKSESKNTISNTNPLMNTLSMLGPLTTMFKVVMEPKLPHPNEVFDNIDIKSELSNKIVEVEDDSEILDKELKDELDDLCSNVTTAMNTPVFTPRISLTSNIPSLDICENGICKLNIDENIQKINSTENKIENIEINNIETNEKIKEINQIKNKEELEKSSPLRYISQSFEIKRGRPKKNQQ